MASSDYSVCVSVALRARNPTGRLFASVASQSEPSRVIGSTKFIQFIRGNFVEERLSASHLILTT